MCIRDSAFVVHHPRRRLQIDLQARLANAERKIGVFVISRHITRIKAVQLLPQRAWQQDRRARYIIHLLHIAVDGTRRVIQPAEIPRTAIAPHNPAGFLQSTIGIDQLRTHHAGIGVLGKHRQQRIQPTRLHFCVVVEQAYVFTACQRQRLITGA